MGITVSDGPAYEKVGSAQEGNFFYLSIQPHHPGSILEALDDLDRQVRKLARKINSFYIRTNRYDPNVAEIYVHTEAINL